MRTLLGIVALSLVVAFGSFSLAKDKTDAANTLKGKVTVVTKDSSNDKITDITVSHGKKGETPTDTVVKADDSTKVTKGKDNEAGTLADVTVGSYVTVTLGDEGKPAVSINVHPAHAKKPADASTK